MMMADDVTTSDTPNDDFRLLGEQITAAMATYQVPGVAVGLWHGGQEYRAGFGVTNVENPLPVDADTLFQIGSTTKTVTATVALRLVEQGTLDLDAPVRTYLPALRLADLPQLTPLGSVWSYNNAGFYLAGRVLEVVTGRPYEALVQEWVFAPLGMDRSFFFANDAITYRVAVGHDVRDGQVVVLRPWPLARAAHPAGGIASTVRDQLRYARFHLGDGTAPDGTRLLTAATMAAMQTPRADADLGRKMALTWFIKDVGGVRTVSHGGATLGQMSAFLLVPERDFAVTILTNADRGVELHREITKWVLQHYLGLADPDPVHEERSAAELAAYAGRYSSIMQDLELTVRDGVLTLQDHPKGGFPTRDSPPSPASPPTRLAFCGVDQVLALDPPYVGVRGEFLRAEDGSIAWFRAGGRIHRRAAAE
jgi:CubicO group peptidase (beta-lactamase class C family)